MESMQWFQVIAGSGGILGLIIVILKIGEFSNEFKTLKSGNQTINEKLDLISADIRQLDKRVSHIEGYLMGRDFRNGTDK